ncbi:hypothetical protein [Evansella clarkii]|uniref:hypothetical protein n=1 Tax=Evansella clarkii TaxID=79879 RepID=UPI001C4371AD|nr:hypothetical protein [Evansella clarkii]
MKFIILRRESINVQLLVEIGHLTSQGVVSSVVAEGMKNFAEDPFLLYGSLIVVLIIQQSK